MAMSTGKVVALIQAMGGGADPAVIEAKVEEWLDAHPEATTTVQDGSITEQKLATSIAQKLGLISSLSDEIVDCANIVGSGISISSKVTFTNGNFIVPSTGNTQSSGVQAYSNFVEIPDGYEYLIISLPVRPDAYSQGLAFYSGNTSSTYISGIKSEQDSSLSVLGSRIETIPIPSTAKYFRTSWIATTYQNYDQYNFVCEVKKNGIVKPVSDISNYTEQINIDGIVKVNKNQMESGSFTEQGYIPNNSRCRNANHYIKARKGDIVVGHHKTANILMAVIDAPNGNILYTSDWRTVDFALSTPYDGYYVLLGASNIDSFDGDFTIYPAKQYFRALPERYYTDEIDTTIASITDKQTEPCLCFPLITDIHYGAFTSSDHPFLFYKTYRNMLKIMQEKRSDAVVCLGDVTDGNFSPKQTAIDFATRVNDMLMMLPAPYLLTIGNHDDNRYSSTQAARFTNADIFSINTAYTYNKVNYNALTNGRDYYIDFDNLKIRLISIFASDNAGYSFSADTVTWFTTTALNTPANYLVVVLTHLSPISVQNFNNTAVTNGDLIASAIESYISGGKPAFQLYGHSHADITFTSPYLSIATCCNKFTNENGDPALWPSGATMPTRTEYTASEDCWDYVIIRPNSRKVNLIRFGAGNDREYTF